MKALRLPTPGWCAAILIAAVTLLRVLYLLFWCPLDLAPDEAHYWDWSRRLDWSYYSKGPLVAVLIRIGCWLFGDGSRALCGTEMAAVRLPAVLCGTLLLWALYRLTVQVFQNERWGLGVVVIALTLPILSAGALLMTIDAPYACAWAWALVFVHRALFGYGDPPQHWFGWWVLAGLCVAMGVLAKHTMVLFVPMVGVFLLVRWLAERKQATAEAAGTPRLEPGLNVGRQLGRAGFWVMAGIGALGGLPILLWNVQNGWVTWQHTRGHLGEGPGIHLLGPLRFVGLQAALLLGYWFLVWAGAMWRYRPGRQANSQIAFLWWMSFPMLAFFALFSFKNGGGEANWPITGYIAGLVLMVSFLASCLGEIHVSLRRTTWACLMLFCGLGLGLTLAVHDSRLARPLLDRLARAPSEREPTPLRRLDPTCRLKGWRTLAGEVDRLRAALRAEGTEPLLASGHWTLPGEIGFYAQEQPVVYCLGSGLGDRHSQYDLWRPNPIADGADFLGQTFILIGVFPQQVEGIFEHVEPVQTITHYEGGRSIAIWHMTVGRGYKGMTSSALANRY